MQDRRIATRTGAVALRYSTLQGDGILALRKVRAGTTVIALAGACDIHGGVSVIRCCIGRRDREDEDQTRTEGACKTFHTSNV